MAFKKLDAEKKNTLVCVGTLGNFGKLTLSQSIRDDGTPSPYVYEKVEIAPSSGSVKAKFNLLWAPAFMRPDVTRAEIRSDYSEFVYKRNIIGDGPGGFLEGLCGSPETFTQLSSGLDDLGTYDSQSIHEYIAGFLGELGPVPFIYTLRQEKRKDDSGERVATQYYEVDSIQHLTEANLKALVKRSVKNDAYIAKQIEAGKEPPAKMVFRFEPSDLGFDVELPATEQPNWVTA